MDFCAGIAMEIYKRYKSGRARLTELGFKNMLSYTKPVKPKLRDLFYSLVIDASANEISFSNWCNEFGYDQVSRKALDIYQACQDNTDKLILLGFDLIKLQKLFEDY